MILVAALLALVPPLVVRQILDHAIPEGDRSQIWWLAGFAVVGARRRLPPDRPAAVARRRGVDRRPAACVVRQGPAVAAGVLHTHADGGDHEPPQQRRGRRPDGGDEHAGSVVSNVVVLVTTLVTMLWLEWRLTLLALIVLPLFIVPARRVGRRLQDISREQMQQRGDEHADDRALQRRRRVAGQAVRLARSRTHVRQAPTPCATPAFARRCSARLLRRWSGGALGTAAIYGIGAQLVVSGDITSGTLVALAALARVPAADRAHQRAPI